MKTKRARTVAKPSAGQALWLELMPFYIREAWLLDERRFKEWLDIFTDDVLYFMPRRKNVPRRESHRELTELGDLAIFEEDKSPIWKCGWRDWIPAWPGRRIPRPERGT